jgi:sugar phosphate permease
VQATVSLSSGWFLFRFGWDGLLWSSVPVVALFILLVWLYQGASPAEAGLARPASIRFDALDMSQLIERGPQLRRPT